MKQVMILALLGFVLFFLPSARAGQGVLLPNSVGGAIYAVSFSYPDVFRHGENYTVSMNMAVLFNDASITNINILQIDVLVVPEEAEPTGAYHEMTKYFVGEQLTSDYSKPLYTIHRETLGETVVANFDEIRLIEWDQFDEESTAKIYVELQFVVETEVDYHTLTYYADFGEMPRVQLLPSESVQMSTLLLQNVGAIIAALVIVGGCLAVLLAIRLRASRKAVLSLQRVRLN